MVGGRAVLAAILGGVLAACGPGATPSAPPAGPPTDAPGVVITPATAGPTEAAAPEAPSPSPTPRPSPKATSKPVPVPPRPTGVKLHEEIEVIEGGPGELDGIGDSTFTASWTKPRTKGVEIRVYGVTTCFGADGNGRMIDGYCLRKHTDLPSSVRMLLAEAPASTGSVTWRMAQGEVLAETLDGVPVYSFVVAAYNAEGKHSMFTIVATGEYCLLADVACPN